LNGIDGSREDEKMYNKWTGKNTKDRRKCGQSVNLGALR
jgi:hypothetical protein